MCKVSQEKVDVWDFQSADKIKFDITEDEEGIYTGAQIP